jgi:cytochrome bd-type quinol oxidase subunit 1
MSSGLAACQTRYHRSGDEVYLLMTRFWGKFMLTASGS